MIGVDFIDSEEAAEDDSIDNDGSGLDKEDDSGSREIVMRTGVTQ